MEYEACTPIKFVWNLEIIASAWPLLGQKLLGETLWDSYTLLAAISQVSTYDMSPSNYGRNGSAWSSNMQAMTVIGDKKAIS